MTAPHRYLSSTEAALLAEQLADVLMGSLIKHMSRADWEEIARALVRQMERELAFRFEGTV